MPNDIDELRNTHPQEMGTYALGVAGSGVGSGTNYGLGIPFTALQQQVQRGQGTTLRIELEHTVSGTIAAGSVATPAEYLHAFLDYRVGFGSDWFPVDVLGDEVLEREQDKFKTALLSLRGAATVPDLPVGGGGGATFTNVVFHSFIDFHDPDIIAEFGTAFPNVVLAAARLYLRWVTGTKVLHPNAAGTTSTIAVTAASTRVIAHVYDDDSTLANGNHALTLPFEIEAGYTKGLTYPYLNPGAGAYLSCWLRRGMFEAVAPEDLSLVTLVRFGINQRYTVLDREPVAMLRDYARYSIREAPPTDKTAARSFGVRWADPVTNSESTPGVPGRRRILPLIYSRFKRNHVSGALNYPSGPLLQLNGGQPGAMPFTTVDFGWRRLKERVQKHADYMRQALRDANVNVVKEPYVAPGYPASLKGYAPLIVEYRP